MGLGFQVFAEIRGRRLAVIDALVTGLGSRVLDAASWIGGTFKRDEVTQTTVARVGCVALRPYLGIHFSLELC